MDAQTAADEVQLHFRIGEADMLTEVAQIVWCNNFGNPRQSCWDRLDKGTWKPQNEDRKLLQTKQMECFSLNIPQNKVACIIALCFQNHSRT